MARFSKEKKIARCAVTVCRARFRLPGVRYFGRHDNRPIDTQYNGNQRDDILHDCTQLNGTA
jgi:hypothetical protein